MRLPGIFRIDWRSPISQLAAFLLFNQFILGAIAVFTAPPGPHGTDWKHTIELFQARGESDSWYPMMAAMRHLETKPDQPVYSTLVFEEGIKFQYPPQSIPPYKVAEYGLHLVTSDTNRGFAVVSTLCVIITGILTGLILARSLNRPPGLLMLFSGLFAAVTFYPLTKGVALGQIQTWITLAFTGALLLAMNGRMRMSGALIGLACLVKPHYGLFVLWGALRKEWGFVISVLAVCTIASIISLMLYGIGQHLDYLHFLSYLSRHGETYFPNQSVNGLLSRLYSLADPSLYSNLSFKEKGLPPFNIVVYTGTLLSAVVFLGTALWASRRDLALSFCIMILSITMASPVAWQHHYALILPIYAVAFAALRDRPVALWWLAGSYVLTSHLWLITNALAHTPFNIVQSYLFFGALILLVLVNWAATREGQGGMSLSSPFSGKLSSTGNHLAVAGKGDET